MRYSNRSFERQLDEAYRQGYKDAMCKYSITEAKFDRINANDLRSQGYRDAEFEAIYYIYDGQYDINNLINKIASLYKNSSNTICGVIITNNSNEAKFINNKFIEFSDINTCLCINGDSKGVISRSSRDFDIIITDERTYSDAMDNYLSDYQSWVLILNSPKAKSDLLDYAKDSNEDNPDWIRVVRL